MSDAPRYHAGMRGLQDARDTRRLADRLAQVTLRTAFSDEDRAFIEGCAMVFVATADADALELPDYDGNGMYRSWGNARVNPHVGLLFIDFERQKRLRVNGTATIHPVDADPATPTPPGAVFLVRITATAIFPNCPRYIHRMQLLEHSIHAPREHHTPPVPAWKTFDAFKDALPERDKPDPDSE